ncbi:MAG: acyltransferase family protein, partial [Caulobacteraceae bacterium]
MTEKRTFAALDGVRGVAALAVMLFHTGTWPVIGRMFPSAYLAVDLFFALSGFVVAHAYGARMANGMGVRAFLRARFVRLWPLFALGMAVGLSAYVIRSLRFDEFDLWALTKSFALQASFLPDLSTRTTDGRMFPMNGPAWSLFFELAVNVVFAFTALMLSR